MEKIGRQQLLTIQSAKLSKEIIIDFLQRVVALIKLTREPDPRKLYALERLIEDYTHLNKFIDLDESVLVNSVERNKLLKAILKESISTPADRKICETVFKNFDHVENCVPSGYTSLIKFAFKRGIKTLD